MLDIRQAGSIANDSRNDEDATRASAYGWVTFVTPILLTAYLVVFAATVLNGLPFQNRRAESLVSWGASYGPLTLSGQWWRLISSPFLNFGIDLFVNMVIFLNVAAFLEVALGGVTMLALFMFAGAAGGAVSLAWHPQMVSAGPAGALFGLVGALGAFLLCHRHSVPRERLTGPGRGAALLVFYTILVGLANPSIVDLAACIGGLSAGLFGGLVVARPRVRSGEQQQN